MPCKSFTMCKCYLYIIYFKLVVATSKCECIPMFFWAIGHLISPSHKNHDVFNISLIETFFLPICDYHNVILRNILSAHSCITSLLRNNFYS
jgi:hypothetical protein